METQPRSGTTMILELSRVAPEDRTRVGVKAANQASLLRAGFPVPDGVVLTTDAYARFAARAADPEGTVDTDAAELRHLLRGVLANLGDTPLAVRSSGVAEDLPDASFAGQYETVLGVEGLDELEEAVRRSWTSALSAHATAYRDGHELGATSMAVLVQEMVDAETAGVAFTANPVTGRGQEVVINAVPGLGDKLVSGEVSPDQWVVRGEEARCEESPHAAINSEQAHAIAELAGRVEAHFDGPQDIEWAIAAGRLHLLQARPITALPEPAIEPIPVPVEVPPGFWFFDGSHGNSHVPIDRFLAELVRPCSTRWCGEFGYLFEGLEFRLIGGWPYQRMVPLGDRQGPTLPNWLMWLLVRTLPMLRRRIARALEATRSDLPGRYIERWYREWQPEMAETIERLRDVDLRGLSDQELLAHIEQARELMATGILIHMRVHGAMAPILHELVHTCEEVLGWDMARSMDLVSGTSYKSTEPARQLWELAELARSRPEVRSLLDYRGEDVLDRLETADGEFVERFSAYLHEYGCRALGHTTLGQVTLAEDPALVLGMISGQIERGYDPQQDLEDNARKRAEALGEAETLLAGRPEDLRRFRRAVERAEKAYPVREDNEFFCFSSPLALLRYAALELGRRLASRGMSDITDDVLYLDIDEAVNALLGEADLRSLVRRRRGEQAWIDAHPGPPSYGTPPPGPPSFGFLPSDARPLMESILWSNEVIMAVDESSREPGWPWSGLTGVAASPGEYTGPVRVVMDESQFDKVRPGDVLVCPATSPVWSVVFPVIGALVTDTGGLLSHPAIIAREYGIPAVVATGEGTTRLHDGELVIVNGTAGTVAGATRQGDASRSLSDGG
ncbi:MAG TPA: PEP/pyruvate-binding domain-containing protein [Acidimicrobiia bacterium]